MRQENHHGEMASGGGGSEIIPPGAHWDEHINYRSIQSIGELDCEVIHDEIILEVELELNEKELTVEKIWDDGDNKDNTRPTKINVKLLANGTQKETATLTNSNDWKYTFSGLPIYDDAGNEIVYTIEELNVAGYIVKTEKVDVGFKLTNTETIDIPVEKIWNDNNNKNNQRPTTIEVKLLANGVQKDKVNLTKNNGWKHTFSSLPKYENGKEIEYTLEEISISGYTGKIDKSNGKITIVNTSLIEIPVEKIWNDNNNKNKKRPTSIEVKLLANGTQKDTVTLTQNNNWKHTFKDLLAFDSSGKEIVYTVEETSIDGYIGKVENSNGKFTISNTSTIDIPVTKTWSDANNIENKRPKEVTVILKANGQEYSRAKIKASESWKYTFKGVPEYDASGKKIVYTIEEVNVSKYKAIIDGYNITNIGLTDIGGRVWKDIPQGKQQQRNNVYDTGDKAFSDIKVVLYKKNAGGKFDKIGETTTDKDGKYLFKDVEIEGTYKVEFEYGGQVYTTVPKTSINSSAYNEKKSAGEEDATRRKVVNNNFYEIVKGEAKNSSGTKTLSLEYQVDSTKHTSTVNKNTTEFIKASKITALTDEFSGSAKYRKSVNLGLYERAQVDLGLMTDVASVYYSINGVSEKIDYNNRDEGTAIDLTKKAKEIDENRKYNVKVYESDYNFRISDYNQEGTTSIGDASKELRISVTYKILVTNKSSNSAKLSGLKVYYDKSYSKINKSWYAKNDSSKNDGSISWTNGADTNGYKTITTSSAKDVTLAPNEKIYVFVEFEVAKDVNGNIDTSEKYIIAEVSAYRTNEGLIDINSEPNNISVKNWDEYVKTYEDDTDRAPGVVMPMAKRKMSGFVWEDKATTTDSDGVKVGNGAKDNNESLANGVVVQLIEKVKDPNTNREYEYIWQEAVTGTNKVAYMDRTGKLHEKNRAKEVEIPSGANYAFADYIPGNYIVRFIYGKETTEDKNIVIYSGQDYKSTKYTAGFGANTSSAKDNKDRRSAVMDYSKEQTNEKAEILANNGKDVNALIANTFMYADTQETIAIKVLENDEGRKVNFGLVERPKSKLVAIKEISNIKISNKGILYVDTDQGIGARKDSESQYTIELDDELINGATMEVTYKVKVKNEGEKDTLYNYFEGDTKYGSNQHAIITTRANLVYDYPGNVGFDASKNANWSKDNVDKDILDAKVKSAINNNNILALKNTNGELYKELTPGQETGYVTITFSKIMSIGDSNDISNENIVEIVSRSNGVGRKDNESTPGNYNPNTGGAIEADTGKALVNITDPMGQTRIYYTLGISSLAILILGVLLIKKKVLAVKEK